MGVPLLPQNSALPPSIDRVFRPLCIELAAADLDRLQAEVLHHLAETSDALRVNEFLDVALAEAIVDVLQYLFAAYEEFTGQERALIVGAARYFTHAHDAEPDHSPLGFEDDVQVLNHVLEALHHAELKIEL